MLFSEKQRQVRFMYIDDNPVNLFLVECLLRTNRFSNKPLGFTSGNDALVYFNKISTGNPLPDIIMLDLHMPGMSGLQFLDTLAKVHRDYFIKIPVIILSSSVNPEDIQQTYRYHCVKRYVDKPLTMEKLKDVLELLGI